MFKIFTVSDVAPAAVFTPVYTPLRVPLLVSGVPLPEKVRLVEPYDVAAVFISAVDVIVLEAGVRFRPRAALDFKVEEVCVDVTSSPSVCDEESCDAASDDVRSRPSAIEERNHEAVSGELTSRPREADESSCDGAAAEVTSSPSAEE